MAFDSMNSLTTVDYPYSTHGSLIKNAVEQLGTPQIKSPKKCTILFLHAVGFVNSLITAVFIIAMTLIPTTV